MLISIIPNVAWPNYYRSLVSKILDNKALYVCIPYANVSYCFTVLCYCMNLENLFKVEYAEKKAIGEHQAIFPLNFT